MGLNLRVAVTNGGWVGYQLSKSRCDFQVVKSTEGCQLLWERACLFDTRIISINQFIVQYHRAIVILFNHLPQEAKSNRFLIDFVAQSCNVSHGWADLVI